MTITIKGFIEGTILHLGNSADGMIQSILSTSMVASNLRKEMGRHQVAVISGEAHGKSGKGDDEIVGI